MKIGNNVEPDLRREYRNVKDNNGETGRGRKTCKFSMELDSVLGHRPASVPGVLLHTRDTQSGDNSSITEEVCEEVHTNGDFVQAKIPCKTFIV